MLSRDACPALEDLLDPLDAEAWRVEWHLEHCPRCRALRPLGREVGQQPLPEPRDTARLDLTELHLRKHPTMPDHVRTGDVWQLTGMDGQERYVAVVAGLAGDPMRPFFTVAGTSPELDLAGPGDVVIDEHARGMRVGYAFMVCTWSAAGTPEDRFEQYLGRVGAAARRTLVSAHRRLEPPGSDALDRPRLHAFDRGEALRVAFRARLQRRLDADLVAVDPREAELPVPGYALLDRQPPAWLTALGSHFQGGYVPSPYEAARVLRLEGVRWLPSTKRRLKWLFTESGAWQQPAAMLDFTVPELETAAPGEPPSAPEREPTPDQLAERYAREVGRALDEWFD
jgi:hypothetical protein